MDPSDSGPIKPAVVRGARACTVCRAAKMKCVASDDGGPQCQRCKRANVECVFEKHRRGRKPGSKLSEASKMLRRLEKGLNSAKLKSEDVPSYPSTSHQHHDAPEYAPSHREDNPYDPPRRSNFPASFELPPLGPLHNTHSPREGYLPSLPSLNPRYPEMEPDRGDNRTEGFPPKRETHLERGSFFSTALNADQDTGLTSSAASASGSNGRGSYPPPPTRSMPVVAGLADPVSEGLMDEEAAKILFDTFFLRLNPFVNLFDPSLHTVAYVRGKCPFLFTAILMASCKFFKTEQYRNCQRMANDYAIRAFAEGWKRVEVIQAFVCLCYWKEPEDTRTFTYIGYACRMAVELGLNRHVENTPLHETDFSRRERRNRERTYLVLFIHDRSLNMQNGKPWMLSEDEIVRQASSWHDRSGNSTRPEDVIVSALVELRRIAAETTEMFETRIGSHSDVGLEVVSKNCNARLTDWTDRWNRELVLAHADKFHVTLVAFFRLHARLYFNSFSIQAAMTSSGRANPDLKPLTACCSSGQEIFEIVSKDFTSMAMLPYGQDSITMMTAYSAVFLLKMMNNATLLSQMPSGTDFKIRDLISATSKAYHDASVLSTASSSVAFHARFLGSLVANNSFRTHHEDDAIDPRLSGRPDVSFHFPASPTIPSHPSSAVEIFQYPPPACDHGSTKTLDEAYWDKVFHDLGFGLDSHEPILSDHPSPVQGNCMHTGNGSMDGSAGTYIGSRTLPALAPPPPWSSRPSPPTPPQHYPRYDYQPSPQQQQLPQMLPYHHPSY